MTIVTYRPKKQPRQLPKQSAALSGPAVVTVARKGMRKAPIEVEEDPEVEARVKAWFAKNIRPPSR